MDFSNSRRSTNVVPAMGLGGLSRPPGERPTTAPAATPAQTPAAGSDAAALVNRPILSRDMVQQYLQNLSTITPQQLQMVGPDLLNSMRDHDLETLFAVHQISGPKLGEGLR